MPLRKVNICAQLCSLWGGGDDICTKGEKKMCGRCSSCRHASIVFKKKWKPAEAGNTGREGGNLRSSQMNRIDACIRMYGSENGKRMWKQEQKERDTLRFWRSPL